MQYASVVLACASLAFTLFAAEPAKPTMKTSFQKPPAAALKALRATVGKPFSSGWVFIDGKYIEPPYKVERFGNAIRINGMQVTGEVVPWTAFIRTQKGVKVIRNESAPAADAEAEPAAEPEPALEDADDAWESSLDDLFDDEPSAKKTAKKTPAYKPKPKKPTVTVTYSFDGEFEHNEKTKAMLDRINALRTKIDQNLRAGGLYCFASRYPMVSMDAGSVRYILERLPDLMKQSQDRASFGQAIYSANIPFSEPLIDDIFKNKFDYLRLKTRYNKEKESRLWR